MKLRASPKREQLLVELKPGEPAPSAALPEIRLKKIIVPTDFSACARKALHYATSLAKQFNAEILLLHVVEPVVFPADLGVGIPVPLDTQIRESAARRLAQDRDALESPATVKASVRDGNPSREIVRMADETNADLIIVGTHGHSGLSHFFIGSTAERVVRHAPCPVLVVRERERDFVEPGTVAKARVKGREAGVAEEKKRRNRAATIRRERS